MPVTKKTKTLTFPEPQMVEGSIKLNETVKVKASRDGREDNISIRRNRTTQVSTMDKYCHIEGGVIPFVYSGAQGLYNSNISVKDVIVLCQKAYYNFAVFRNVIDLMTEFTVSNIYFTGGNKQSKAFFDAWAKRVNLWKLQDSFFREFFRSGNVFLYKLNATFSRDDLKSITDLLAATSKEVPVRYIILNPADIQSIGSASFITPRYVKVLNDFEVQVLTNPQTDEDKELAKRIGEFQQLKRAASTTQANQYLIFELSPEKVKAVFYKKQDYEPFAVPFGFPVLADINWKQELKNIDQAISRTVQQAVLLVTMGDKEVGMPSKEQLTSLRKIFENESIGRVLVADYTTNVRFVIPEIGNILDPKKYEVVDRDIKYGLNNVLMGDDKYANASMKVEVFLARLKHARESFLNEFLLPEVEQIGKELGFKSIPRPRFKDADFKDDANLARIYSHLIEIGVLTPEEGITAIETGRLPLPEESLESQERLKDYHQKGMYQPLINNPMIESDGETTGVDLALAPKAGPAGSGGAKKPSKNGTGGAGRPTGTGSPKSSKKVGRIGKTAMASEEVDTMLIPISSKDVATNLNRYSLLEDSVTEYLKTKFNRKRLSAEQRELIAEVTATIATNEVPEKWLESISEYVSKPVTITENFTEVEALAEHHAVDRKTAIILLHSRVKE